MKISVLHHVARNESETAGRPNDGRMPVRGVVERLGNGENLRFGRPGQNRTPDGDGVRSVSGLAKGNKYLNFLRLSVDASAKEIKPASVTKLLKGRIFHLFR